MSFSELNSVENDIILKISGACGQKLCFYLILCGGYFGLTVPKEGKYLNYRKNSEVTI